MMPAAISEYKEGLRSAPLPRATLAWEFEVITNGKIYRVKGGVSPEADYGAAAEVAGTEGVHVHQAARAGVGGGIPVLRGVSESEPCRANWVLHTQHSGTQSLHYGSNRDRSFACWNSLMSDGRDSDVAAPFIIRRGRSMELCLAAQHSLPSHRSREPLP
jgi:hypothetical protein